MRDRAAVATRTRTRLDLGGLIHLVEIFADGADLIVLARSDHTVMAHVEVIVRIRDDPTRLIENVASRP